MAVLAIDLGGTWVRLALFREADAPPARVTRFATQPEDGFERVLDRIAEAARALRAGEPISCAGLAAPGPLDPARGVLLRPPNLRGWPAEAPIGAALSERIGVPVFVDNDANVAALGEWRAGAGRGVDHLIYFTVSTGIGGGVILGGRVVHGAHGYAGELGHMVIQADGPPCLCGGRGCLETLASGTAIARLARERLAAGEPSRLTPDATAAEVFAAAAAGDRLAAAIVERAMWHLGIGVVNALHLFDPALVILGGGVTNAGRLVFDPVARAVARLAMPAFRHTPVVRAALGDDAGLYGAAALAFGAPG
ncbi:MAG: ROK family protein [Chloroflexota bacterium]|nr:ROK family protein [Dehalococcoidia bacterium]MDW8254775.1 ROK family protein [Chloroflexota bacterium]